MIHSRYQLILPRAARRGKSGPLLIGLPNEKQARQGYGMFKVTNVKEK